MQRMPMMELNHMACVFLCDRKAECFVLTFLSHKKIPGLACAPVRIYLLFNLKKGAV